MRDRLFALAAVLFGTRLFSQQRSLTARKGENYVGRILSESANKLYLDIGPCGGTIIVFQKPYSKDGAVVPARCGAKKVDTYRVTQK